MPLDASLDSKAIIRQFIENWLSLISPGRYVEALRQIDEPNRSRYLLTSPELAASLQNSLRRVPTHHIETAVRGGVRPKLTITELVKGLVFAAHYDGTCWCGGTQWQGHVAMRISVSSWLTTGEDVSRCLETIIRIAGEVRAYAKHI